MPDRVIVGISGSSGVALGIRLLKILEHLGCERHVIITEAAKKLIAHETSWKWEDLPKSGAILYDNEDLFAAIGSGSFKTNGMAIAPCSMKTLAGIASGYADNLLLRTADVCLKERRRLVLVTRETPLSLIHIENMRRVTLAGGIILPPVVTMYGHPKSLEDMLDHIVGKVLDAMGVENHVYQRWR